MPAYLRDPNSVLDYEFDWGKKWLKDGDTIETSEWIDVDSGITVDDDTHTQTTTTVWVSGGTVGQKYSLTNRITTADGRTEDETLIIKIRER